MALRNVGLKSQKRIRIPKSSESTKRVSKKKKAPPKNKNKVTDTTKEVQKKVAKRSIVLIQVAKKRMDADVRVKLRKEVDPDASKIRVVGAKFIKKRDLLIRIGGSSKNIFEV